LFTWSRSFSRSHYAFHVTDEEFDSILNRVKAENIPTGGSPWTPEDGKRNDGTTDVESIFEARTAIFLN
jgi:hypothetical protein